MPAQESLEIEVKDFGPIVEAKVDLRPLTVFVGPSNTGKSYLAILIYALHRFFRGVEQYGLPKYSFAKELSRNRTLRKKITDDIVEWTRTTLADRSNLPREGRISVPDSLAIFLRSAFAAWEESAPNVRRIGNEIGRCFGIGEISDLIRKSSRGGARIIFRNPDANGSDIPEQELMIEKSSGIVFKPTIPEKTPLRIEVADTDDQIGYLIPGMHRMAANLTSTTGRKNEGFDSEFWVLAEGLFRLAVPQVAGLLHLPAFYLPADRTGVMHAHRVVVGALIKSAARGGFRKDDPTPTLSGVLADFLEQLIELGDSSRQRRKSRRGVAEQIEKTILDGAVSVRGDEITGYPSFIYRPRGWEDDLPLINASSMVSELAPVVLYLRHVARSGNVLIVEEPESHLHPGMQVEFTRQLAAIVKSGVRVIVTTHSEWLLEELANLVRLSQIPQAQRNGIDGSDAALRPDQVGAWLFRPKNRPKGSVVERIDLDDSGLYPSDFDDVAVTLHNNWAEITSRIGSSR